MPTPLHSLEIDRYLDWYQSLSLALTNLPETEARAERYRAAGRYLLKRYIRNNPDSAPDPYEKTAHGRSSTKAHELHIQTLALNPYISGMAPAAGFDADGWKNYLLKHPSQSALIPALEEWEDIHFTRKVLAQREQKRYRNDLQKSPLPALDFTRRRLEETETERPVYAPAIEAGNPLPARSLISDFIEDLAQIDFAHYLKNELNKLEAQAIRNPAGGFEPVQWQKPTVELFGLMVDLQAAGLIEAPETGGTANLARIVCAVFTDKDGKPFDFENVRVKLSKIQNETIKVSWKRADFSAWKPTHGKKSS